MKQPDRVSAFPRQIRTLPLSWLSLSVGKRLLIVALSYGLGVAGLWFLFPLVHNGASMFLPIVSAPDQLPSRFVNIPSKDYARHLEIRN